MTKYQVMVVIDVFSLLVFKKGQNKCSIYFFQYVFLLHQWSFAITSESSSLGP